MLIGRMGVTGVGGIDDAQFTAVENEKYQAPKA